MNLSLTKGEKLFLINKYKGQNISIDERIKEINSKTHKLTIETNRKLKNTKKDLIKDLLSSVSRQG